MMIILTDKNSKKLIVEIKKKKLHLRVSKNESSFCKKDTDVL